MSPVPRSSVRLSVGADAHVVLGNRAEGNTGGFTMKPDPLENLMSKFDITGQTLALQRNGPLPESASSAANDLEVEPEPLQPPRSASRRLLPSSKPSPQKQLKHALSVNAAHVITHDYLMLSQPLSEVNLSPSPSPGPNANLGEP